MYQVVIVEECEERTIRTIIFRNEIEMLCNVFLSAMNRADDRLVIVEKMETE